MTVKRMGEINAHSKVKVEPLTLKDYVIKLENRVVALEQQVDYIKKIIRKASLPDNIDYIYPEFQENIKEVE